MDKFLHQYGLAPSHPRLFGVSEASTLSVCVLQDPSAAPQAAAGAGGRRRFGISGFLRMILYTWIFHIVVNMLPPQSPFLGSKCKNIPGCTYDGFLKWWYPTTMGFPTKNDLFGVFRGYHHLRKHPYDGLTEE